jgi:hypothetical protein
LACRRPCLATRPPRIAAAAAAAAARRWRHAFGASSPDLNLHPPSCSPRSRCLNAAAPARARAGATRSRWWRARSPSRATCCSS